MTKATPRAARWLRDLVLDSAAALAFSLIVAAPAAGRAGSPTTLPEFRHPMWTRGSTPRRSPRRACAARWCCDKAAGSENRPYALYAHTTEDHVAPVQRLRESERDLEPERH